MCIVKPLFALSQHTLTTTVDPPRLEGCCGQLQKKHMKPFFSVLPHHGYPIFKGLAAFSARVQLPPCWSALQQHDSCMIMQVDMCQKSNEPVYLLSRCREFQRTCSTSKRASGSHLGSSFTMTLTRWMQSYWAASWLAGRGALESPGLLNRATCQEWTNHLGTLRQLCWYDGSDIRCSLCDKQAACMHLHP